MRYSYGTNDSLSLTKTTATPKKVAEIIKEDVELGKWNIYEGGRTNSITAKCRYKKNGFIFHNHLLIYGTKTEFEELESLIKPIIEVIPRQYN